MAEHDIVAARRRDDLVARAFAAEVEESPAEAQAQNQFAATPALAEEPGPAATVE